jgi:hypothetical protein
MQSTKWMNEVALNDGSHPKTAGYMELANLVQKWSFCWFNVDASRSSLYG